MQRFHASFSYQAGSWDKKRRVVAKVEWHPGEFYPRVGFIVTNLNFNLHRVHHRHPTLPWTALPRTFSTEYEAYDGGLLPVALSQLRGPIPAHAVAGEGLPSNRAQVSQRESQAQESPGC